MKTSHWTKMSVLFAALLCLSPVVRAASTSELLQQALYAEEVEGNVNSAIKLYGQVADNRSATRGQAAQALYRQGMCYLKIKDDAGARTALEKLVANYSDQSELVEKGKSALEDLTNFDPAALMPAGTLVYVEFGSPGKQVETIVNMLKGTPFENPLAVMGGPVSHGGQPSPANLVSALLNPSMLAEFKKLRSSAIGISDFSNNGPKSVVSVLYPGKSDALRGVLLAAIGVAGAPGQPIEGMQTVVIQNTAAIAYDDKVIIAAQPVEQLAWCVRQYKGKSSEPTLVTKNQSFANLSKKQRQEQALTIWIKADETFAKLQTMFPEGEVPQRLRVANGIVDLGNLDSVILTSGVEADGLACKADLEFKNGRQSLAYDLIRTPVIRKEAFDAVPAQAVALASFALSPADSAQSEKLRAGIRNVTGLDVGREIFANIEQITLFVMPESESAQKSPSAFLPNQFGLTLTSHDPAQTQQLLAKLLGTGDLITTGSENKSGKYRFGQNENNELYCYLDQLNGFTVLSLNREIVDASLAAIRDHKSARTAGPLSKNISKLSANAAKLILADVGGAIRLGAHQVDVGQLDPEKAKELATNVEQLARATESTTIELRTDEQLNSFAGSACISGMPPLNAVVGPATQISRITDEARGKATERSLRQETGAVISPASTAPVIDGKEDELWKRCPSYRLENFVKGSPMPTNDFSASYRAMWDKDKLYLLVDVTDSVLRHDPAIPWQNSDSIEIYIDAANSKAPAYDDTAYQYCFNWDQSSPALKETKHNRMEGVQFAQGNRENGYRLELAIPWSTLGTKAVPGNKIGLDVHVNDNRGGSDRNAKLSWHDQQDRAWQSPQAFGNAELGGLVGWWKLDESQGTVATDSSGGNHNGTLVGNASWKPGQRGGALDLSRGGYVSIADKSAFDMAGEMTIACWVNLRSVPEQWMAIVTKGDSAWRLSTQGQNWKFHFAVDDNYEGGPHLNGAMEVSANEWHHVAAVYAGDVMRLYIDGKLDVSEKGNGRIGKNDFNVFIGENSQRMGRSLDGLIDDVRIYNYAIPESEVMTLAAGK